MSNRRKTTSRGSSPRKPRFPVEALPPKIAAMARAVAKSEKTTLSQAALAALIAVSDVVGAGRVLADGVALELTPADVDLLVPDPADRPAVRRAYAALVRAMPPEARKAAATSHAARETAAGNMKVISRDDAVDQIAARYRDRDAYLVAAGPQEAPSALRRLAPAAGCTAYLDQGEGETVMTVTGPALQVMPEVMNAGPGPVPVVAAIPKAVPARVLARALGNDIPADGSRDLIMLTSKDGSVVPWPVILVEAISRVSPQAALEIRAAERRLRAAKLTPAGTALLDQADAAGAHGVGVLAAMVEHAGGSLTFGPPQQVVRDIAAGMLERAATGKLGACPHLSPSAPALAFWLPYAPDIIRCVDCMGVAGRQVTGTQEDKTCDHCRRVADEIYNEAVQLPPVMAEAPGLLAASGPVTIMFGLCPDCHATKETSEA